VHEEFLLEKVVEAWSEAKLITRKIKDIFLYMDKNFAQPKELKPV
jgi:hypothetical protein